MKRWQKSDSFGFAVGSALCIGENQMCHLCDWLKLMLKKCGEKKYKTLGLLD